MLNSLYVINTNMYVVVNFIHINMHLFLEKLNFDDGFFFTSTSSPFFFVQKVSIIYMSECTMLLCYYRIFDILWLVCIEYLQPVLCKLVSFLGILLWNENINISQLP